MKKFVLLLYISLLCNLVFAQTGVPGPSSMTKTELKNGLLYTTITIRPKNQLKWTGEVWKSVLGNYGFGSNEVKAGKDMLGTICRSWVLWDISSIPSNAIIESASIKAYCNNAVSAATHRLEIKQLNVDPLSVTANVLFNSIGSSTVYFTGLWNAMTSSGYKEITYAQAGLSALQNDLGNLYHGVGISESGENDPLGTFRGYYWNSGVDPEPILMVTYSMPAPDLMVITASGPASARQGQNISVSWTIKNTGTALAPSSKLGYYLSTGAGTNLLGQYNISALPPGSSYLVSDSITIPSDIPAGTNYNLLFCADYLNEVSESNENNNIISKPFAISPVTYNITVAADPSEGGTVSGGLTGVPSGTLDTVSAYPNTGWSFVNWTENGLQVSVSPDYIFNVTGSRNLTAKFVYMVPGAPGNLGAQLNVENLCIDLTWSDNSINEDGFYIERRNGPSANWQQIYSVGSNTTNHSDYVLSAGIEYYYRVRAYNAYGESAYSNEQSVQVSGTGELQYGNVIPENNFLSNNYPNPFNPSTKFSFGIKSEAAVKLSVYNITGQLVENIIDNPSMSAGIYTCLYSPGNLSSGLYLYVLTVNGSGESYTETKKMVYIK